MTAITVDHYARPSITDPEEEQLSRDLGRSNLLDFTTYTYRDFMVDPMQEVISNALEHVLRGDIHRLMIFAPPQHGKSELVSVRFPAYWLAKRQDDPIIICSYGAGHAYEKVFLMRQVVESPEYKALFPQVTISARTKGGSNWRLKNHRAAVISAGVGGPITGYGAMLGIIDDPIKNWQEAESFTFRDKLWKWYRTTFRTRIWTGGAIILVMTRWHEDDLAGRLLKDQSEKWDVLRLTALAESQKTWDKNMEYLGLKHMVGDKDPTGRSEGDALCPSRYSKEALEQLKEDVGTLAWAGQYMQTPRLPEGNIIKRFWFKIIEPHELPEKLTLIRYWDKAATEDGGTRSAGVLMGKDRTGKYYVIDVVIGQWSTGKREEMMLETAKGDRKNFGIVTIYLEQEPGSGGVDSYRASAKNLAGFTVRRHSPSGPKLVRLGPFQTQAEIGNVALVRGTWNWDYLDELTAIPAAEFWDQTDATSGAFNRLASTGWSRGSSE